MNDQSLVDTSTNTVQNEGQVVSNDTADYEAYRNNRNGGKVAPEPVVAEQAKADDSSAEEAKGEEETKSADGEDKRPSGWKRQKAELERLKAENEELRTRATPKEPQATKQAPVSDEAPKISDFESVEEWADARDAYKQAKKAEAERQNAHQKRMAEAKKAHGEQFDDAIDALVGINISTAAYNALEGSDISANILFHLGQNAEEAEKLSRMDAVQQIKYIGRLEAKLADAGNAQQQETKPLVKAVKGPPAPIKPLTGGKSVGSSATAWMDAEDYEVYRAGRKRAAEANQ